MEEYWISLVKWSEAKLLAGEPLVMPRTIPVNDCSDAGKDAKEEREKREDESKKSTDVEEIKTSKTVLSEKEETITMKKSEYTALLNAVNGGKSKPLVKSIIDPELDPKYIENLLASITPESAVSDKKKPTLSVEERLDRQDERLTVLTNAVYKMTKTTTLSVGHYTRTVSHIQQKLADSNQNREREVEKAYSH